ncbi:hypothetical protein T439DRAFT_330447 [Meredithblackwellia eburnea MCA 4105]
MSPSLSPFHQRLLVQLSLDLTELATILTLLPPSSHKPPNAMSIFDTLSHSPSSSVTRLEWSTLERELVNYFGTDPSSVNLKAGRWILSCFERCLECCPGGIGLEKEEVVVFCEWAFGFLDVARKRRDELKRQGDPGCLLVNLDVKKNETTLQNYDGTSVDPKLWLDFGGVNMSEAGTMGEASSSGPFSGALEFLNRDPEFNNFDTTTQQPQPLRQPLPEPFIETAVQDLLPTPAESSHDEPRSPAPVRKDLSETIVSSYVPIPGFEKYPPPEDYRSPSPALSNAVAGPPGLAAGWQSHSIGDSPRPSSTASNRTLSLTASSTAPPLPPTLARRRPPCNSSSKSHLAAPTTKMHDLTQLDSRPTLKTPLPPNSPCMAFYDSFGYWPSVVLPQVGIERRWWFTRIKGTRTTTSLLVNSLDAGNEWCWFELDHLALPDPPFPRPLCWANGDPVADSDWLMYRRGLDCVKLPHRLNKWLQSPTPAEQAEEHKWRFEQGARGSGNGGTGDGDEDEDESLRRIAEICLVQMDGTASASGMSGEVVPNARPEEEEEEDDIPLEQQGDLVPPEEDFSEYHDSGAGSEDEEEEEEDDDDIQVMTHSRRPYRESRKRSKSLVDVDFRLPKRKRGSGPRDGNLQKGKRGRGKPRRTTPDILVVP